MLPTDNLMQSCGVAHSDCGNIRDTVLAILPLSPPLHPHPSQAALKCPASTVNAQTFSCLMQVMMVDPVIAGDGHTYERTAFQDWLQHYAMSPVDKKPLKHTRLVTNQAIKNALAVHWQQT